MSIAVLIATHNASSFIGETIDSLSRQQRQPDEVIIVDDSSTDNTVDIVGTWARSQPFDVKIIQNELKQEAGATPGPAGCRTTGLRKVSADLVAILDHDDLFLPSHLRLTEQALLRNPDMELCFGDATEFQDGGATIPALNKNMLCGKNIELLPYRSADDGLRILTQPMFESLLPGNYVPTAANLWRRKTAVMIGGFDRRAGGSDDLKFFATLSRLGSVGYFPFPIARKRVHLENLSHPRNALRSCWDHISVLLLLQEDAKLLNLTRGEVVSIESQIEILKGDIGYHSSKRGIGTYWEYRNRLGYTLRPKDLVRSLYWDGRGLYDRQAAALGLSSSVSSSPPVSV